MSEARPDLEAIKQKLIQRRDELEEQLLALAQEHPLADATQEPGDQAWSTAIENLRVSMQNAEAGEYQRITRALEKIEEGTYGVCTDCGEDISDKRLKMYPNASRCLVCQEAFEDKANR